MFDILATPNFDFIMDFIPGEDVIEVRGTGSGFSDIDTNGDGVINVNDTTVFGAPMLVNLGSGNAIIVAGVAQLTPSDLLFV
ncbi:MAG: hypothetical protein GY798_08975 [Hyphomicrobiales bacterium]|nr:hypothetical protein [Hyphomicrobiales bacterium]